jgi:ribosome maturation protein Sdo1
MVRADTEQIKVHYKGNDDDFIIMVESADAVKKWKEDKSTPLIDVVNSYDVFCTHKYGTRSPSTPQPLM